MDQRQPYPPMIQLSQHSPYPRYDPQLQNGPYHRITGGSCNSQYHVPNTSASAISNNPLTRSFDTSSLPQSSFLPSELSVEPRLDEMSFASHSGRSSPSAFTQNAEPWNPLNLRKTSTQHLSPHVACGRYRPGPGSIGKQSAQGSDSAYHSQSAVSNEFSLYNADSQQSIMSRSNSQHRSSVALLEIPSQPQIESDQRPQVSIQSGPHDKSLECSICYERYKCKSDYKKHMLRHSKPFLCEVQGCKRDGEGFTTRNDLDRHKKSVHGVNRLVKSYKCAAATCRGKAKIWTRQDNFKQHIERMHKGEDVIELTRLSQYMPPSQVGVQQNDAINPRQLDRELDGMGSTFSNHNGNFLGSMWSPNISQAELSVEVQPLAMYCGADVSCETSASSGPRPGLVGQANIKNFRPATQKAQVTKSQAKISTAPQTKAHQTEAVKQRRAMDKLSGALATQSGDCSSDTPSLEQSILRLITSQNNSGVTKEDALKAVQYISNLVKKNPGLSSRQPRRVTRRGFTSDLKECHICNFTVARECDLKKHMKRHERSFGCTYPQCRKRFGAKSDWKRHENSQHFQLEAYRCRDCGKYFLRVDKFETHLKSKHHITDQSNVESHKKSQKIGKNCQGTFWCGFCKEVKLLNKRRNAAWDERFDHIANHFTKDNMKIDEWVCAEENKKKKDILREMDRNVFDNEDDRDSLTSDDMEQMHNDAALGPSPPPEQAHYIIQPSGPLKRKGNEEPLAPERRKRRRHNIYHRVSDHTVHYCCECGNGPCGPTQLSCFVCQHKLDSCCIAETTQE